jgi:D-lyxose ketol-isomerase
VESKFFQVTVAPTGTFNITGSKNLAFVGEEDPGEMMTMLPEVPVWFSKGREFAVNMGDVRKANTIDKTDTIIKLDSVFLIII